MEALLIKPKEENNEKALGKAIVRIIIIFSKELIFIGKVLHFHKLTVTAIMKIRLDGACPDSVILCVFVATTIAVATACKSSNPKDEDKNKTNCQVQYFLHQNHSLSLPQLYYIVRIYVNICRKSI